MAGSALRERLVNERVACSPRPLAFPVGGKRASPCPSGHFVPGDEELAGYGLYCKRPIFGGTI